MYTSELKVVFVKVCTGIAVPEGSLQTLHVTISLSHSLSLSLSLSLSVCEHETNNCCLSASIPSSAKYNNLEHSNWGVHGCHGY